MPASLSHGERMLAHQETQSMRRALQITSGWLALLARTYRIDQPATRAALRHEGEVIFDGSLGEALDMANEALEPETVLFSKTYVINGD